MKRRKPKRGPTDRARSVSRAQFEASHALARAGGPVRHLSRAEIARDYGEAALKPEPCLPPRFNTRFFWPPTHPGGRFVVVRIHGGQTTVGTRRYADYDDAERAAGMCRDALPDALVERVDYQPMTYDQALRSTAKVSRRADEIPRREPVTRATLGDTTIDHTKQGNGGLGRDRTGLPRGRE